MADTTGLTGGPQQPSRVVRQEVAPKGGYAPINVARNVPKSIGRGAGLLLVGTAAMMSYGFYRLGNFNVKRRYVEKKYFSLHARTLQTIPHTNYSYPLILLRHTCRMLKQEKKDIRLAIIPLLQAEEDARFVVKVCCCCTAVVSFFSVMRIAKGLQGMQSETNVFFLSLCCFKRVEEGVSQVGGGCYEGRSRVEGWRECISDKILCTTHTKPCPLCS